MTTEKVGAAAEARKRYSERKGTKKQKPWKIVEEMVGKTVGRFFHVGTMTMDMVAKTTATSMMKATCANLKDLWRIIMKR